MRHKKNNIFWVTLLAFVLFSGTIYFNIECSDQGDHFTCHTPFLESEFIPFYSTWDNNTPFLESEFIPFYSTWDNNTPLISCTDISCTGNTRGICCQDCPCISDTSALFRNQQTNIPQKNMGPGLDLPRDSIDREHVPSLFFNHHPPQQTASIYTLIQSFLC